jgi:hypothetical protein
MREKLSDLEEWMLNASWLAVPAAMVVGIVFNKEIASERILVGLVFFGLLPVPIAPVHASRVVVAFLREFIRRVKENDWKDVGRKQEFCRLVGQTEGASYHSFACSADTRNGVYCRDHLAAVKEAERRRDERYEAKAAKGDYGLYLPLRHVGYTLYRRAEENELIAL